MGPFPNAHDRVSNITPKAGCQELDELHTTARLELPHTTAGALVRGTTVAHGGGNDDEFSSSIITQSEHAHAVRLASARQHHPENQKENQAGHSSERTVDTPTQRGDIQKK